ncbi:MAG: metallophosphoesterase [Nitrospira sp.]|nr:metallophosphoesterase [Nitrospira sp.]
MRWLHLSDFHFRESQSWEQDYVLKAFSRVLERTLKNLIGRIFLFITGDVAFSGKQRVRTRPKGFVLELLKATGYTSDRLFVIPGNHDVDRKKEPDAFVGARVTLRGRPKSISFVRPRSMRNTS